MPKKKPEEFEWLGRRTYTRPGITPGLLETGKRYPVKDVPKNVLTAWVATGHATLAKDKEE